MRQSCMLVVNLPDELEHALNKFATLTGRSKSYYVRQVLANYLADQENYVIALERLKQNNPRISLEEMECLLGLGN